MSVNLIYRFPCQHQNHKYFKRFNQRSILEWFQNLWDFYCDDIEVFYEHVKKYIGEDISYFQYVFSSLAGENLVARKIPPKDYLELMSCLNVNIEKSLINQSALQVYTHEGRFDASYYLISDEYVLNNMKKCAYLVHPTWELPEVFEERSNFDEDLEIVKNIKNYPIGTNEGVTYICLFTNWNYISLDNHYLKNKLIKIQGTRLLNLNSYLKEQKPQVDWNEDLIFIRSQISNDSFGDTLINYSKLPGFFIKVLYQHPGFSWDNLYVKDIKIGGDYLFNFYQENSDWFSDIMNKFGHIYVDTLDKSKFQFSKHMIQSSIHTETWDWHPVSNIDGAFPVFDHIIVFDDLWATANPDLANSILNFTTKWDVLS